jgi:predicted ATP-dependent serine protease
MEYVCSVCHSRHAEWSDSCPRCGSWNAIELDFEEERLSPEALGVLEVPVWGVAEDSGEISVAAVSTAIGTGATGLVRTEGGNAPKNPPED